MLARRSFASAYTGSLRRSNHNLCLTSRYAGRQRVPANLHGNFRRIHARAISYTAIPKFVARAFRVPIAGLGVGAGAVSYANYKFEEVRQTTTGWISSIQATASDVVNSTKSTVASLQEELSSFEFPAFETPDIVKDLFNSLSTQQTSKRSKGNGSESSSNGKPDPITPAALFASALVTSEKGDLSEQSDKPSSSHQNDLMSMTRKLIEIRSMLMGIDHGDGLQLPSIVVIGSQSSGKSSVLESIVGHEFLPKGNNMVTRRPIELTLVNTSASGSMREYGEFPEIGLGRITSFPQIQQTLTDLNLAVPSEEAVSDDPIFLRIYSPNVPDLTMIDLPGYVQISSMDQPEELKSKIAALCEKYIKEPNIILAVCAANVDLANSPALRASRKVDPLGLRTIGVVTKMDLVGPDNGAAILSGNRYPLHLGYVGVVNKAPSSSGLDSGALISQQEDSYFSQHPEQFGQRSALMFGNRTLRSRLMHVLESSMLASLHGITNNIQLSLEEATYQYKVQYNDRRVSPESYLAETIDTLKTKFREWMRNEFKKTNVRSKIRAMLDERCMDVLEGVYWGDSRIEEINKFNKGKPLQEDEIESYWKYKLEAASSLLTKSGIGRNSTSLVADGLQSLVDNLVRSEPFNFHSNLSERLTEISNSILRERVGLTSDQVENCIKPYKYTTEIEFDADGGESYEGKGASREWDRGRTRAISLYETDITQCESRLNEIKSKIGGRRRLEKAIAHVRALEERQRQRKEGNDNVEDEDLLSDSYHFSPAHIIDARHAMLYKERLAVLKSRLAALKAPHCRSLKQSSTNDIQGGASNWFSFSRKSTLQSTDVAKGVAENETCLLCPEAFLNVVSDKLAATSALFINIELLDHFLYEFPREIDSRLVYDQDRDEILRFAKENPKIRKHMELQDKKDKLEEVMKRLQTLNHLRGEPSDSKNTRRNSLFKGIF